MATKFQSAQANKLGDTTAQIGKKGQGYTTFPYAIRKYLDIWNCRIKQSKQSIAGDSLIWGNETYGIWNTFKWGTTPTSNFILGHSIYAILGSGTLGSSTNTYQMENVFNSHNLFPEYYENNRFIDTDLSTGSWFEGNYYLIADGSEFFSEIISKEDNLAQESVYIDIQAKYSTTGSDASDYLTSYALVGTSSILLSNNTLTNFTNIDTNGLKIKIINATGSSIQINNYLVEYS